MGEILQGTTPSLTIKIKTTDFLVTNVIKLELTLKNAGKLSMHNLGEVTIDSATNSFTYDFTEEETLSLTPHVVLEHQWRFMLSNGKIVGTKPLKIEVADLYSNRKLTEETE